MSCCHRFAGFLLAFFVGATALAATAEPASAQRADKIPDQIREIQTVEPLSGPVGTRVRVHTENLPIQARIHVGVGARHIGFEALTEVQQGQWGEVEAELAIPEYWTWDRPLVLIVFNGIFSPIGLSDPFHVTNAAGLIQRTGHIADEGGSCVGFRDQDDYYYSLQFDRGVQGLRPASLQPGDELIIEGTVSSSSSCGDEDTIRVTSIQQAP